MRTKLEGDGNDRKQDDKFPEARLCGVITSGCGTPAVNGLPERGSFFTIFAHRKLFARRFGLSKPSLNLLKK